jgi:hypothetical protein
MSAAQPYVAELARTVDAAVPALRAIADDASGRHPAPGKWSPREIVGHLIDSASNNHQRFVRAQFQDDLVFHGYDQNRWVAVQAYQHAPWLELIDLWAGFNRQLGRVMAAVPDSVRLKAHTRHNLHEIAWQTVAEGQPATLDDFMADYVGHLQHHLRQILGAGWTPRS